MSETNENPAPNPGEYTPEISDSSPKLEQEDSQESPEVSLRRSTRNFEAEARGKR